jgi:hypothetical protein
MDMGDKNFPRYGIPGYDGKTVGIFINTHTPAGDVYSI